MLRIREPTLRIAILAAAALLPSANTAVAGLVTLDFNTLGDNVKNATTLKNHVQGVLDANLGTNFKITTLSGARSERNYTGDNRVVGPRTVNGVENNSLPAPAPPNVSGTVRPITLGTSDAIGTLDGELHASGVLDTFLVNKDGSTTITMIFDFKIYSVSFDYEIFPDGTMPDGTGKNPLTDPNWPDFKFEADDVLVFRTFGAMPADGLYPYSPNSVAAAIHDKVEKAPQYIGHSGTWYFPNGVMKLEFIDWPRMIGIDNLEIDNTPTPEPASLAIWSLLAGVVGLGALCAPRGSGQKRHSVSRR